MEHLNALLAAADDNRKSLSLPGMPRPADKYLVIAMVCSPYCNTEQGCKVKQHLRPDDSIGMRRCSSAAEQRQHGASCPRAAKLTELELRGFASAWCASKMFSQCRATLLRAYPKQDECLFEVEVLSAILFCSLAWDGSAGLSGLQFAMHLSVFHVQAARFGDQSRASAAAASIRTASRTRPSTAAGVRSPDKALSSWQGAAPSARQIWLTCILTLMLTLTPNPEMQCTAIHPSQRDVGAMFGFVQT